MKNIVIPTGTVINLLYIDKRPPHLQAFPHVQFASGNNLGTLKRISTCVENACRGGRLRIGALDPAIGNALVCFQSM